MQTKDKQNQSQQTRTGVREAGIDIIKGASNIDQIQAMQDNAANAANEQNRIKPANILEVDNGSGVPSNGNIPASDDLNDPATRGI